MIFRYMLVSFCVAVLPNPAHAGNLIDGTDETRIAQLLKAEGITVRLDRQDGGDPVFRVETEGTRYSIYFQNCEAGTQCRDLRFRVAYDLPEGLSLEQVNGYNSTTRFGRMFLDTEMDPFFEWDVNLAHGVTVENLTDSVNLWQDAVAHVEAFLDNRDGR